MLFMVLRTALFVMIGIGFSKRLFNTTPPFGGSLPRPPHSPNPNPNLQSKGSHLCTRRGQYANLRCFACLYLTTNLGGTCDGTKARNGNTRCCCVQWVWSRDVELATR